MAVDFHDVFLGKSLRRQHDGGHDLVDHLPGRRVHDVAVVDRVAGNLFQVLALKQAVDNSDRIFPGDADDGDPAFSQRR